MPKRSALGKCHCRAQVFHKNCGHQDWEEPISGHYKKKEDPCENKTGKARPDFCTACNEHYEEEREKAYREQLEHNMSVTTSGSQEVSRGQTLGVPRSSQKISVESMLNDATPHPSPPSSRPVIEKRRRRPMDSSTSSSASPNPSTKKSHTGASSSTAQTSRQQRSDTTARTPAALSGYPARAPPTGLRPVSFFGNLSANRPAIPRSETDREDERRAEENRQALKRREEQIAWERERHRQAEIEDARRQQVPLTYYPAPPAGQYPVAPAPAPGSYAAVPARSTYPAMPAPPGYHEAVATPAYRTIAPVRSPYEPQPPQQQREEQRPVAPPPQPDPRAQRSFRMEFTPGVRRPGDRNLSDTPGKRAAEQYTREKNALKREQKQRDKEEAQRRAEEEGGGKEHRSGGRRRR